jgi:hypothetical protein
LFLFDNYSSSSHNLFSFFFETNQAVKLPTILKRRTQTGHYNRATPTTTESNETKKTTEATNSTNRPVGLRPQHEPSGNTKKPPLAIIMQQQQRVTKQHEDTSSSSPAPLFTDDVPHRVNRCHAGLTAIIRCKPCSCPAIASACAACRRCPAPD